VACYTGFLYERHTNSTGVLSITPLKGYLLFYNILSCALWIQIFLLTVAYITTPHPAPASTQSFLSPITKFFSTTTSSSSGGKVVDQLRGSYHFMGLGNWVKVTQTLAVLDVVHAALGLVKSNVGTAASQVFSRLWAVWAVVEMVPEVGLLLLFPFDRLMVDSRPSPIHYYDSCMEYHRDHPIWVLRMCSPRRRYSTPHLG